MVASKGMIVGGSLLALCWLTSAAPRAMEPDQADALPSTSSPSALPAFLGDDALPALHEAWRAREGALQELTQPQQSVVPLQNVPAAVTPTPMTAEPNAGSVRQRAEELSRRFGADGAASQSNGAKAAPASVTVPPAVAPAAPVDQAKRVLAKPASPVRKQSVTKAFTTGAVTPQEVDPLDASVRTQSALSSEKLRLAAPPPPSDAIPPLPKRAPKVRGFSAVAPRSEKAAVVRVKPFVRANSASTSAEPRPDPKAALRGTIMTNELHSFGWNSQPD